MWKRVARFSPSTATGRVLSLWRQPMNTTINEQQLSKTACDGRQLKLPIADKQNSRSNDN
jgi:hypothetical protein